jgi:P27 family predicted phage terminase small subunit
MKRGQKAEPLVLRELHGNTSQHALPTDVPEGEGVLCEPPEWMDEDQRRQWDYALEYAPRGLLTATDRQILATWCVASVTYAEAVREVRRLGLVVKTKDGNPIQNPFLAIQNRQALLIMRAGEHLGFSPAARMSMAIAGQVSDTRYIGAAAKPSRLEQYLAAKPDRLDS